MPVPAGGGDEELDPSWRPSLAQVAAYVPHRTLVRSDASTQESDDTYQFTFDQTTIPTDDQVQSLIGDGCAWVSARVSPMATASETLASAVAALLVAAWIERSWPNDDQALQRANDMEKRVDLLMKDLVTLNDGETGESGG